MEAFVKTDTVNLHEIFLSPQGEGVNMGEMAVFVRLAGCNLRCSFCDTADIKGTNTHVKDVVQKVREMITTSEMQTQPIKFIIITGGEPTIQSGFEALVIGLRKLEYELCTSIMICLETNGTNNGDWRYLVDWVTCSPKDETCYKIAPQLNPNEIKLVVTDKFQDYVLFNNVHWRTEVKHIWLQPESNRPDMMQKCLSIQKKFPWVRIGLQLHKVYNVA